ncbi:MAG: hypothetical protein ACU84H_06025 [Gammaproteobacteria bacterium]
MNSESSYVAGKTGPLLPLLLTVLVAGFFFAGCDKNEPSRPMFPKSVQKYNKATVLEGKVADNDGLVKGGTVKVTDSQGQLVASTELHNTEHYRVEIPADTVLPIVLAYYPQANEHGGDVFMTAVVHPNITQYDINPLTTAIAKKAEAMGGYTHANLVVAAESMGTVPDKNKTTAGFRGDPTKQYGGWH